MHDIEFAPDEVREYTGAIIRMPDMAGVHGAIDHLCDLDVPSKGFIAEFGVHAGCTINKIAKMFPKRKIHGFDAFEGLPEDWHSQFKKGFFKLSDEVVSQLKFMENVVLHKGWFSDTVPAFKKFIGNEPAAFLHLDADLYSSTICVLDTLNENIVPGTIIGFNEYFGYPDWAKHEYKAWQEFVAEYKVKYQLVLVNVAQQQIFLKVTAKGKK